MTLVLDGLWKVVTFFLLNIFVIVVVEALPVIILCCPIKVFHLIDYQHMFPKIFNFAILKEMAPIFIIEFGSGENGRMAMGQGPRILFHPHPHFLK